MFALLVGFIFQKSLERLKRLGWLFLDHEPFSYCTTDFCHTGVTLQNTISWKGPCHKDTGHCQTCGQQKRRVQRIQVEEHASGSSPSTVHDVMSAQVGFKTSPSFQTPMPSATLSCLFLSTLFIRIHLYSFGRLCSSFLCILWLDELTGDDSFFGGNSLF